MTRIWTPQHLPPLVLAYAVAALVGPTLYASSQLALEHLFPTARPAPAIKPYPAKMFETPKTGSDQKNLPSIVSRFDDSDLVACTSVKDRQRRLECYDTQAARIKSDAMVRDGGDVDPGMTLKLPNLQ